MDKRIDLYLASASPRRRELLAQIGVRHATVQASVDESPLPNELPADYVCRLSVAKARAGQHAIREQALAALPVLGSDTTVVMGGDILGKPANESDAISILSRLSGGAHQVMTAVTLAQGDECQTRLSVTTVEFRTITLAEMQAYWATGEPADKAGAYGIQGLGAVFVKAIHGSYSGVVGLPLAETSELLTLYKIPFWQVAQ
jgi:septum formation protein